MVFNFFLISNFTENPLPYTPTRVCTHKTVFYFYTFFLISYLFELTIIRKQKLASSCNVRADNSPLCYIVFHSHHPAFSFLYTLWFFLSYSSWLQGGICYNLHGRMISFSDQSYLQQILDFTS